MYVHGGVYARSMLLLYVRARANTPLASTRARTQKHPQRTTKHVAASGVMVELWLFLIKDAYQSKLLCSVLFNIVRARPTARTFIQICSSVDQRPATRTHTCARAGIYM